MRTCNIGAAAVRSGLSIDTIRYYDTLELLVGVKRDTQGRRQFDDDAVRWLIFLRQMRATGMSLEELRKYIKHREEGASGVSGVLEVLRSRRASIVTARNELNECLAVIEAKIGKYESLEREHSSPGPPQI